MRNEEYIFVYGRLRTGFWNRFLLGRQKPLGTGHTRDQYGLYASVIPYVRADEAVSPVWGEVYAVTPRMLRDLDSLMAHPAWYRRRKVIAVLEDGRALPAWMYTRRGTGGVLVETGDLLNRAVVVADPD